MPYPFRHVFCSMWLQSMWCKEESYKGVLSACRHLLCVPGYCHPMHTYGGARRGLLLDSVQVHVLCAVDH